MKKCPPLTPALIEYLEQVFPTTIDRLDLNATDREVGVVMGQSILLTHLRAKLREQSNNILESTTTTTR